jgi:MoxR-like ATPase
MQTVQEIERGLAEVMPIVAGIREQVGRVIVGQRSMVDRLLIGLLSEGHVPSRAFPASRDDGRGDARAGDAPPVQADQFTPDLLPSDLVGTEIYNPTRGEFTTRRGPIFANIVLADEINRARAKVRRRSSRRCRSAGFARRRRIPAPPFLVLATQNPIEQEGTYPLPEAQADRFMLKIRVGYPTKDEEREILRRSAQQTAAVEAVASADDLLRCREAMRLIRMEQVVSDYIVELVHATRFADELGLDLGRYIEFGASPRATLSLAQAARAYAFLEGRGYVTPDDVRHGLRRAAPPRACSPTRRKPKGSPPRR